MDFESLLHVAKKNQLSPKEPVKCLQTKFKPPTKEQREKAKVLSEGVQRFLARKEYEEKKKKLEDIRKLEELEALRARDPKANKRIQTMLKRTKSASKSVMDDVDSSTTADTIAGPIQPDDDDYGFTSETSSAMYNKLVSKWFSSPSDEPKFAASKKPSGANLMNTKERVKMALLKQEEYERLPHKRKRRKKDGTYHEDDADLDFGAPDRNVENGSSSGSAGKSEKPKPKRTQGPPPMDFMELLKLAETKQHEPVVVEQKSKKNEPDQLMTKKQREEHRKQEEWKRQREERLKAQTRGDVIPDSSTTKPIIKRIPKIGQSTSEPSISKPEFKIPKVPKLEPNVEKSKSVSDIKPIPKNGITKSPDKQKPSISKSNPQVATSAPKKIAESETEKLKRERDEALRILKEKEEAYRKLEEKEKLIRERDEALAKLKLLEEREAEMTRKPVPKVTAKSAPEAKKLPSKPTSREFPPKDVRRPETIKSTREFPPKDVRRPEPSKGVREFPPKDVRRPETSKSVREFPPKDVRRPEPSKGAREFPPRDVKGIPKSNGRPLTKDELVRRKLAKIKMMKRARIEDSDEEYDSELDDFIDDGPDPSLAREDVSAVISQIFNYNKNKYSKYDEDDDDECMESNWSQISKEEYFSTKCGIMEDLEDMKQEKMEIARKKKKR